MHRWSRSVWLSWVNCWPWKLRSLYSWRKSPRLASSPENWDSLTSYRTKICTYPEKLRPQRLSLQFKTHLMSQRWNLKPALQSSSKKWKNTLVTSPQQTSRQVVRLVANFPVLTTLCQQQPNTLITFRKSTLSWLTVLTPSAKRSTQHTA